MSIYAVGVIVAFIRSLNNSKYMLKRIATVQECDATAAQ